ncbi:jg20691 [Pararge aegeria aegeria]|uniref:Jg20691 protein n=1 Tax=Pararge aegeria aegeria TaxID=348720 RepID=A0A8S4QSA5_9NEOP|nr:jg20691 [Pararge aegeria aegeria]
MAPSFSKFTSRTDVKIGLAASAALSAWVIRNALKSRKPKKGKPGQLSPEERVQYMIKDKDRKGPKAQVDARFFAELKVLWHIMVPGLWTKESAFMFLIALSLISRTLCDLWLIQHTTLVEGVLPDQSINHRPLPIITCCPPAYGRIQILLRLRLRNNSTSNVVLANNNAFFCEYISKETDGI